MKNRFELIALFTALGMASAPAFAAPGMSVSGSTGVEGNAGTTDFTFQVTLSEASDRRVLVKYHTISAATDTATAGEDYVAVSGELAFEPGETLKTFSVPVNGDTKHEAEERFSVGLYEVVRATLTKPTGKGVITNDDEVPGLSVSGATGAEGDAGTTDFTFEVTLSEASGKPVTVKYHTISAGTDTATAGEDYVAVSGDLAFGPGETVKTFTVPVIGDRTYEAAERFTVGLYEQTRATLSRPTARGVIENDDPENVAPQAFDDGAITDEDALVVIDVLANDVDADDNLDAATVTIAGASHGVATANAQGQVSFLADPNYFGTDAGFTYTVADTAGATSNVASVAITVNPVNDAPVAQSASSTGGENAVQSGVLTATDIDGDTLTFAKASDPAHGGATVDADGTFTYQPQARYAGSDSFTFVARDGQGESAPATVTLTVNDSPDPNPLPDNVEDAVNDPLDPALFDCTGPAGDPAPNTPEFEQRDAENIFCTTERHQDALQQPANNPYMVENYGADPYRAPARNAGTRFRHDDLNIPGVDGQAGMSFDRGQPFNAEVYRPCAAGTCTDMPAGLKTYEPPYPVAIVMHGAASDKKHLEWATQPLAERGYFVLTANGTGDGLPDILLDWLFDPANPYAAELDLSRIGTTGHSLGAENATRVQGDPRVSGIVAWDPCDGTPNITECRGSEGSKLHGKGAEARTPTLFLTADYLGFPGYPQPQVSVPGDLRVEGFGILRDNGVDTMLVTPRATTHLDWAGAFTFGNRLNEATSLYYTVSWFDRYVKAKLVVDGSGAVVPTHGRTAAQERAYRQAVADEAFARLTASRFDGLVDLHNISQGRWDRVKAIQSSDLEYGGNVPYRVAGLALADRYSFYHRSVCFISQPDLLEGDGTQVRARADTTEAGDMRKTGCTVAQPPVDSDGDGVPDGQDAFPLDPAESADTDEDGTGDNADADDDSDGIPDADDACPTQDGTGPDGCVSPLPPNASCTTGARLRGNRHYNVKIESESGETISFEVYEPKVFNCGSAAAGAHPLILQGHGFGGQRTSSDSGFADYRNDGYAIISIDQRGFGQSTGTVRVMDPDFEGKDLVRILDWAEANLDYLAYRDEIAEAKPFVARPANGASTGAANLVVGAMGGSYGGGFQFLLHNVDAKDRLDALAADVTWHDLRYSLNPGDALKSAFGVLLSAGGEQGSYQRGVENREDPTHRGLDPYIVETLSRASATGEFPHEALAWFNYHSPSYWCGLNGEPQMPYWAMGKLVDGNTMIGTALGEAPGANTRTGQIGASVLLSQGFRDTLFNFNEAWWNYQCAKMRGGDARLITHQSGHILNPKSLISSSIPSGTPLDIQTPPGKDSCGALRKYTGTRQWFGLKLRGQGTAPELQPTEGAVCMSLADDDAVFIPDQEVLAPAAEAFTRALPRPTARYLGVSGLRAYDVPQGLLAQNLYLSGQTSAAIVPLLTVDDMHGAIVAGIPQVDLTVTQYADQADNYCREIQARAGRAGCDSAIFIGLGLKRGAADWVLIDDQLTPVRDIGGHHVALAGVAERLQDGDQLALMIYGYHPQYLASFSRDPLLPLVDVSGRIDLPLYAVGADGQPDFARPSSSAVVPVAEPVTQAAPRDSLAGCLMAQNPESCVAALESLQDLQNMADCPFDESGIYCAADTIHDTAYDAVGVDRIVAAVDELVQRCYDSTVAAPACEAVRSSAGAPDRVVVLSEPVARGDLVYREEATATPSAKTVDGSPDDWMGAATRIGGTDIYEFGEHIYSDFLFDARGADDGEDARRLVADDFAAGVSNRARRVDALQQAAGAELGIDQPVGFCDYYGNGADFEDCKADLKDGTDLTEVRWAYDGGEYVYFLARFARLQDPANARIVILADTNNMSGMQGLALGLSTQMFDRAVLLGAGGAQLLNLTAPSSPQALGAVAVDASGWTNTLEARLPLSALADADGALRVAVLTLAPNGKPANVAYRFDEPVAIYNESAQALSLYAGNIDHFAKQIPPSNLAAGRTQSARPGPGYHERQFVSGANISSEDGAEDTRLQPYGLFVPHAPALNPGNEARLTFWTHYRGGKAHSGASWTPRLIHQLGEEQGNIVVTPRARGTSTWYVTRAHQDFFEVFADVAGTGLLGQYAQQNLPGDHEFGADGLFRIDPSRVYISGYSMGGFATYLFSGLYPDLFAAGYSTSGAVTQGAWTGIGPDDPRCVQDPSEIPEVGEANLCFVETDDSRANAQLNQRILDNTRHVPIAIHHGTNDELAITPGAVGMGKRLQELQYRHDLLLFLGYEHYTQAIVDEWADGAHYLNQFARPANPRVVTYKVVPALVKAVNEIRLGSSNGGQPFTFHPDGAYWVDNLVVRDGADGSIPETGIVPFGQIEAESGRLPGTAHQAVPRSGTDVNADPDDPEAYVSTPAYSPGSHSTPYVRSGIDWIETEVLSPNLRTFSVKLVNLARATLDVDRMGLNVGAEHSAIVGSVTSDGTTRLTFANLAHARTICVDEVEAGVVAAGDDAVVDLAAGEFDVRLAVGTHASCIVNPPPPFDPQRPDYADLCTAFGVAGSEPVCGALRDAERQLREACENRGQPRETCTVTGGDLQALVWTCATRDPSAGEVPACRIVSALVDGAAGWCRQVSSASDGAQPPELCAMIGGVLVSEAELGKYEASWTHRALALQDRLGYGLPLAHNTILHTHNSFNAQDDNTPPTLSGSDFNQYYDITGQLRMDIRAIELDVHWVPGRAGSAETLGYEPMLCHGRGGNEMNAGCTTEKPLREGLRELRAWLDAHPDEVVLLYIEDDIGGVYPPADEAQAYAVTSQVIEDEIGERVFRPENHGAACGDDDGATVASSWLNVSRQSIVDAGHQLILFTENCRGSNWDALFHQKNDGNWVQGTQGDYEGFDCFASARRGKWTRVWEDSTVVTATAGGGAPAAITPEVTSELMRCGLNMPGFDRLTPQDGRLRAAVWSWSENQPTQNAQLDCAMHSGLGRFIDAGCGFVRPFACVSDTDPDAWVIAGNGPWSEGAGACPSGHHFSVPANGFANERLKAAKDAAGVTTVWLNYAESSEGQWVGDAAAAPGQPGTVTPPDDGIGAACRRLGAPEAICDALDALAAAANDLVASLTADDPHPTAIAAPLLAACAQAGAPDVACARAEDLAGDGGLSRWVDPRIGSYPPGFTNPGPVAPFGMVGLGPDTEGPLNYGGYYFHNALVSGLSHVHMSAGVYKGGYIPVLPFTGERVAGDVQDVTQGQDHPMPAYSSSFDHASEAADAGYYSVVLSRYGVHAELTATERAGFHRYTFNDPAQAPRVLIDVARTLDGYRSGSVRITNGALLGSVDTGHGFPVFFAARVGAPFTATTFDGAVVGAGAAALSGTNSGVILDFADAPQPILVKVGLSYTDEAGALANLDAEIPGWEFDAVRAATRAKWDEALAAIEVEGGTLAERVSFYTALYRLQHFPNLHSDVDGRYRGPDGAIHADTRPHYSQFSSWDSYRGQNQMQAEIAPQRYGDMIRSLMAFHEQAGYLPRWQEGPKDASHMSGDPIVPFLGEAWCRGQLDAETRAALWPQLQTLVDRRDGSLEQLGYLPVEKPERYYEAPSPFEPFNTVQDLLVEAQGGSGQAGTTLEYGIADFSLALMAQSVPGADAGVIAQRSLNYRNLQDPDGWIHPRHADGSWLTPFAPELGYGFQEGTSWQYSWLAMHDYAGVIQGMDGDVVASQRLDTFFNLPADLAAPIVWPAVQNQATAFGILYVGNQYAPGNEHDLEAPFVYNYTGEPWKAQAVARAAASIYTPTTTGLPGNDDLGALSGWLLWTMSGVYPMNPGTPLVVIGSPVFQKVTLHRPGGDFVIEAPGASAVNKFVQSAALDGAALNRSWLILPRGATTLRLEMGPAPNLAWAAAADARPPSLSTHGLAAFGCGAPAPGAFTAPTRNLADDADGDGVANGIDNCPTTANGLQEDSDADGTGDACDSYDTTAPQRLCAPDDAACVSDADEYGLPGSTVQALANRANSITSPLPYQPRDSDSDGVPDFLDLCPAQAGASSSNGCPAGDDADGDGVSDGADACPATPAGMYVTPGGCSAAQRDSDADGLYDGDDNCPAMANPGQADADGDGIGDDCATGRLRPTVVVAVADSGINPYHKVYYRPDLTAHPCTYVKGFDCSVPALNLSIGEYATWQEAFDADRVVWEGIQRHQWYWIPKTNIIGAVCDDPGTVAGKQLCILDDSSDHGTSTTSAVLTETPDALLLFHEGDSRANDLASPPVIPDIQSHSWGPIAPIPLHAFEALTSDPQNCGYGQHQAEALYFLAAGNFAPIPAPADDERFCPSSIVVGGGPTEYGDAFSWSVYDFASWVCRPGARGGSLDRWASACGTSDAAPTAAGAAAGALLEIRRSEGYVGRSSRTMLSAAVSRAQFQHALRYSATYHPKPRFESHYYLAPVPLVPGKEYLVWGWGFVDRQIVPDLVACATGRGCLPKSPDAVLWNSARDTARAESWSAMYRVLHP